VLGSKVLIDASNPYPPRDGTFAVEAIEAHRGAGLPVAALLPLARIARAFSTVNAETQVTQAGRSAPRVGMPVAADSIDARAIACRLVADAGFDPVDIGPLARAALFDPGTPVYNTGMSADELRTSFAASAA
jgi:predicted dinucleotide-binding enzyme